MKKLIGIVLTVVLCMGMFTGCTSNQMTKNYGGDRTITLPTNSKLIDVEWDDDDLWYMTRPMIEDDVAETYTFQEDSSFGVFEGTITIVETKE